MRSYETMIVFDTNVDAQSIQVALDRALETIRTSGGNPGAIDRWGKRPLAYEINKRKEGYYVLVEFSGESGTVVELDRILTPVRRSASLQDSSTQRTNEIPPCHGAGLSSDAQN